MTGDGRLDRVRGAVGAAREVVGWATVDLERAQRDLGAGGEPAPDDVLLGARCRLVHGSAGAARAILLEPSTEGRLAATLARHGEGPAARYLLAGTDAAERLRAAGLRMSTAADGPFGRQRLVLDGPRWGPHIAIVDGPSGSAASAPATIDP